MQYQIDTRTSPQKAHRAPKASRQYKHIHNKQNAQNAPRTQNKTLLKMIKKCTINQASNHKYLIFKNDYPIQKIIIFKNKDFPHPSKKDNF